MSDQRPIGVFDSGVGGLSVLKELRKLLPGEDFIFIADQKYVPYGEKSTDELNALTLKISRFLEKNKAKAIVVACNTATCHSIGHLRENVPLPFIGTVPAVKPAAQNTKTGVIGIISTPATSKSAYLKELIKAHAKGIRVVNIGCFNLENSVETGELDSPEVEKLIYRYTAPLKKAGADAVVLGCTHYPFLKSKIRKALGAKVKLVDSGLAVAKRTKAVLAASDSLNKRKAGGRVRYFTTGEPKLFNKAASGLLKTRVNSSRLKI